MSRLGRSNRAHAMEWNAKSYDEGGASSRSATETPNDAPAEVNSTGGLPGGAVASEEEFAHLETCLNTPKRLSPTILYGAALLQGIGQKRR